MQPIQVVHRAVIVNALTMSLLAVACIRVMDKVADWLQEHGCCTGATTYTLMREAGISADWDTRAASALRNVMGGLGLLVGICWDKAFEGSYETVLDPKSMSRLAFQHDKINNFITGHPTLAQRMVACLGLLVSAGVGYAWYWHIVPSAMKEEEDHKEAIDIETLSHSNIKLPKAKTPTERSSSDSEFDVGCLRVDSETD